MVASCRCGFADSASGLVQLLVCFRPCLCSREMRLSTASCIRFRQLRPIPHFYAQMSLISSSLYSTWYHSRESTNSSMGTQLSSFWKQTCQYWHRTPHTWHWMWSPEALDPSCYYSIAFYVILQLRGCLHRKQLKILISSCSACFALISHLSMLVVSGHRPMWQLWEYLMKDGSGDLDLDYLDSLCFRFHGSLVPWSHCFCDWLRMQSDSSSMHCSGRSSLVSIWLKGLTRCSLWMQLPLSFGIWLAYLPRSTTVRCASGWGSYTGRQAFWCPACQSWDLWFHRISLTMSLSNWLCYCWCHVCWDSSTS